MSIFISIAAYRDPQLAPTIADCLAKAQNPDGLRFGICWQHGPDEPPPQLFEDGRFRVLDVHWRDSRGACWARAEVMKLWRGEDYFLQIDSHHRFVRDWDTKLIELACRTGSPKPILSTYPAPFVPGEIEPTDGAVWLMKFDHFTADGIPSFLPVPAQASTEPTRSLRARFVAAGFLFTIGDFVREVPYDPELYFMGEEITVAIRAFTYGYDLFHPSEHILWHEYTRHNCVRHWDDHVAGKGVERAWYERDTVSRARVARFLAEPFVGPYGCGAVRSFADYEAYAGLSFRHRRAQDETLRGVEPPNPPTEPHWAEQEREWNLRIVIDRGRLPVAATADPGFWYVGAHDSANSELFRQDAGEDELRALLSGDGPQVVIDRKFMSNRQPVKWTVWPYSRSQGWLEAVAGDV